MRRRRDESRMREGGMRERHRGAQTHHIKASSPLGQTSLSLSASLSYTPTHTNTTHTHTTTLTHTHTHTHSPARILHVAVQAQRVKRFTHLPRSQGILTTGPFHRQSSLLRRQYFVCCLSVYGIKLPCLSLYAYIACIA